MITLLVALHITVCFVMIAVILLQAGKGAEIGAAFGGSSQTIFGSRGPGTFLSKVTVGAAVIFMLTSLFLSLLSGGRSVASGIDVPDAEELPLTEEIPLADDLGASTPDDAQKDSGMSDPKPPHEENPPSGSDPEPH